MLATFMKVNFLMAEITLSIYVHRPRKWLFCNSLPERPVRILQCASGRGSDFCKGYIFPFIESAMRFFFGSTDTTVTSTTSPTFTTSIGFFTK